MSAVALLEKVSIEVEFQLEMERNPNVQGESNVRSSSDDWGLGSCGSHDNQDHASWVSSRTNKFTPRFNDYLIAAIVVHIQSAKSYKSTQNANCIIVCVWKCGRSDFHSQAHQGACEAFKCDDRR